ncbi:MAG: Hsp33 family molecular chaperone HslO [Atopococcus tabaci]|uniref:33 kDa chaperonin n=1 Tax=Atopococcus tabaci TaxID=269774 RepID=A0AA43UCA7_9LACT|nr:Hsp33 family molecular chaperone HslO [Atopococcus tabaci]
MRKDYLVRGVAFDKQVRIFVADTSKTVQEAQKRHDSWSTSTAALGRTIIGSLFLGTALKGDDTVTVRIQGEGPIGYLVGEADAKGNVRGYIKNPQVSLNPNDLNKIDVAGGVGARGELIVTKDLGLKEPYVGRVNLISGEIAEDFTYYMTSSEQTPSAFAMGVLVNPDESVDHAGGFMVQLLPGASEETISQLEENLVNFPHITELLKEGKTPEEILELVCQGGNPKVLGHMPVQFHCTCSKERFAQAMVSLGSEEIQSMIDQDGGAEAICHFCRQKYIYSAADLEQLQKETE